MSATGGGRCARRRRPSVPPGVGDRAPDFRAVTAGSGREVSLKGCAGRPLVLVFHSGRTAHVADRVNRAVRERYPSPEDVVVASVADLSLVPPLYWLTASIVVEQARGRADRAGSAPAGDALALQDWGGFISRRFGVRGVDRNAVVVVVDERRRISCFYDGQEPTGAVLDALGED